MTEEGGGGGAAGPTLVWDRCRGNRLERKPRSCSARDNERHVTKSHSHDLSRCILIWVKATAQDISVRAASLAFQDNQKRKERGDVKKNSLLLGQDRSRRKSEIVLDGNLQQINRLPNRLILKSSSHKFQHL